MNLLVSVVVVVLDALYLREGVLYSAAASRSVTTNGQVERQRGRRPVAPKTPPVCLSAVTLHTVGLRGWDIDLRKLTQGTPLRGWVENMQQARVRRRDGPGCLIESNIK